MEPSLEELEHLLLVKPTSKIAEEMTKFVKMQFKNPKVDLFVK